MNQNVAQLRAKNMLHTLEPNIRPIVAHPLVKNTWMMLRGIMDMLHLELCQKNIVSKLKNYSTQELRLRRKNKGSDMIDGYMGFSHSIPATINGNKMNMYEVEHDYPNYIGDVEDL